MCRQKSSRLTNALFQDHDSFLGSEVHAAQVDVQQIVMEMNKLTQGIDESVAGLGEVFVGVSIIVGLIKRNVQPLQEILPMYSFQKLL